MNFGSIAFPTKAKAQAAFKQLLNSHALQQPIAEPWHTALLDLVRCRHPSAAKKIGPGVHHFEVRTHLWQGKFRQRGFYIIRVDQSVIDFSYLECFAARGTRDIRLINEACREAISKEIFEFKKSAFYSAETIACAESGAQITWEEAHVDHASPWPFSLIVSEWRKEFPDMPITVNNDDDMHTRFTELTTSDSFRNFHNNRANLRVIHSTVNISLGNRSTTTPPPPLADDPFLRPAWDGGYVAIRLDLLPDLVHSPLGKCRSCRFSGPLTEDGRCAPCVIRDEKARQRQRPA